MAENKSGYDGPRFNPLDYPQCLELTARVGAIDWHEHIPFVKALVQLLRPKILVKLGVRKDDSYLALCEAAAALGVACFGVDTANGAVKRAGVADDRVLSDLHASHDPLFGSFSRLVQGSGSGAAAHFADNSIELLYVDGMNPYETVCRDWEAWRTKISRSGVVLFQGTNAREGDTGMWRLWKELRPIYRTFEFLSGEGLGVLLVGGPGSSEALNTFFTMAEKNPDTVRRFFAALGQRSTLRAQVDVHRANIEALETNLRESESRISVKTSENQRLENERLSQAAENARLTLKIDAQTDSLRTLEGELHTLREQHEKATLDIATVTARLEAEIGSQKKALSALQEDHDALRTASAESAREAMQAHAEIERLSKSFSFRLGHWLTAPFRLFRDPQPVKKQQPELHS